MLRSQSSLLGWDPVWDEVCQLGIVEVSVPGLTSTFVGAWARPVIAAGRIALVERIIVRC
jgi:hypothetical protein